MCQILWNERYSRLRVAQWWALGGDAGFPVGAVSTPVASASVMESLMEQRTLSL